jgi:hypothetical protein
VFLFMFMGIFVLNIKNNKMKTKNKIKTVNVHFAKLDLSQDIPTYQFDELDEVIGFCLATVSYNTVYLVSLFDEVFVSSSISSICIFIESMLTRERIIVKEVDIFLQEYPSFQCAYEVSLNMMEVNPLCYPEN